MRENKTAKVGVTHHVKRKRTYVLRKISKCVLSLILCACLFLGMGGSLAATAATEDTPSDLRINMLTEPYGIPASGPTFSWVMNDSRQDEMQTAYEIIVSNSLDDINSGKGEVLDTGEVKSGESTNVSLPSLKLSDNSLYYWSVRTWDSDGNESGYSDAQAFTTAVGADWASTGAVWGNTGDDYADGGWDDYTVELDMKVDSSATGIDLRDKNSTNFYMWQFSTADDSFNPTICKDGTYSVLDNVDLQSKGINLSDDTYFHVKIALDGSTITTYINGVQVDERTDTNFTSGTIGFRDGNLESGEYKNVKVYKTDASGNVVKNLYVDGFANGSNPFSGGTLSDGALVLGKGQNIELAAVTASSDWKDYAISLGMKIDSTAAGINFRVTDGGDSYYTWRFDADDDSLEPSVTVAGQTTQLAPVDLGSSGITLQTDNYYTVKIAVQGSSITTYIDGTKIDDRTDDKLASGTVGFFTESSDSGSFKDIEVDALTSSGDTASKLYSDDFAAGVDGFSGGWLSDGELTVDSQSNIVLKPVAAESDFVFLRDSFDLDDTSDIQKAVVSVTSTSSAETKQYTYGLYLNGASVGVGPSPSIDGEVRYNSYDVTSQLKDGENVIGALNYALSGKQFLLQMTVFYKDGTSKVLVNSGRDASSWRYLDGTAVFGESGTVGTSYYVQSRENIDATLYPFGWDNIGFDDSAWLPVNSAGSFTADNLKPAAESNMSKVYGSAATVVDKGNGDYFIDLGKEVVGGLSLTVDPSATAKIELRYGEEESGTDSVKYQMRTGNDYEETWTLKPGSQTIENFGLKTFRYVEILNSPVTITADDVRSISERQAFDEDASGFTSSSDSLNSIYDMTKYTIEETNQDLEVDSQSRERTAYQGDAFINMLSSFAVDPDVTLPRYTTEYLDYNPTWPAEYKLMSVILTWDDYMYTGDLSIVSRYYDELKSDRLYDDMFDPTYDLIKRVNDGENQPDSVLVDWPVDEQDGYDTADAEYNTVLNAVAYGAYSDIAQMANVLGNTADAATYGTMASKIQNGMMTELYNSATGAFSDGLTADGTRIDHYAQHASAFALAFGVVTDPTEQKAVAAYVGKDGTFKTSVYGALFVLAGLYNADAGDTAMELMNGTGLRSWNHMINDLGATISAEDWDPSLKSNMSFSHPWGSAPASQIVSGLFGIQPLTAGFSTFKVKFQPGGLTSAQVKVPTIKGEIDASFNASSGFSSSVSVPCNTRAEVYIPAPESSTTLVVDGTPQIAERSGDYLYVELGSGSHTVTLG